MKNSFRTYQAINLLTAMSACYQEVSSSFQRLRQTKQKLRPGQTINVGRPNMLGEATFYRLATVFDDHSTCWMMLEHV